MSPYRIVRRWDESHSESVGPYGEIPLSELEKMFCHLLPGEQIAHFIDVGAGRGRVALWAACTKGWRVQAIECIPTFCTSLNLIVKLFSIGSIEVIHGNFADLHVSNEADLVYMNLGDVGSEGGASCLRLLSSLRPGARVVTVGFDLTHLSPRYKFEGSYLLKCPWGEELAVLQRAALPINS